MKKISILICLFLNVICTFAIEPKLVWKIEGEEAESNCYTISDDGNTLYIQYLIRKGSVNSNYIYIWDIPNKKLIDSMPGYTNYFGMVVSADQKYLVCIDPFSNGTIVYDINSRTKSRIDIAETANPMWPGIFRISRVWNSNNYAVNEWTYGKVQIINFETGTKVKNIDCEGINLNYNFFFSKNGKYIAAINDIDTTINIYNMDDGPRINKIKISAFPENISFANENHYFLINFKSESGLYKVNVYDFDNGQLIKEFPTKEISNYSIFQSNDEDILTTYSTISDIQVNSLNSPNQTKIYGDFKAGSLTNYKFGNSICAIKMNGEFSIFDTKTLESNFEIKQNNVNNHINCTKSEITPNGKYIITTDNNGIIFIRDLITSNFITKIKENDNQIISIDFSSDSKTMMLTDLKSKITLWDISNIAQPKYIKSYQLTNSIRSTISSDGKNILTGGIDKKLKIINTENDEITVVDTSDIRIQALTFSNDMKKIAYCTTWHLIIMEYSDTKKIYERVAYIKADSSKNEYSGGLQDVQFSNDDKYITVSASDGKARLYSSENYNYINRYLPASGESTYGLISKSILFENNDYLFVGDGFPQLKIYDRISRKPQWTEQYKEGKGISGAGITNDNIYLFVSYYDATLALYKLNGPTSVDNQININNSMDIYPNPASDYITISLPNSNHTLQGVVENERKNGQEKVQIFNTLGIEVSSAGGGVNFVDGGGYRIDISHLQTGVYFIKIGDKVKKFVKI